MPVITVASPKGGAGKSTASVILGTELAHAGAEITILDCDPNRSISIWADRASLPPRITVRSDVGESEIVRTIKQQDADGRIVIVDLEGVASRLVSRAISQADLVLTPMRATTLDATIGVRALALISEEEEALGRSIPHAVVFTMTRAIKSKQHTAIEASLKGQGGRHNQSTSDGTRGVFCPIRVWRRPSDASSARTDGTSRRECVSLRSSRLQPPCRKKAMNDKSAFSIDIASLKSRRKDVSSGALEKADFAGEQHGFVDREPKPKRGRQPSPRTGQVHAKVMPNVADEIANEAKLRGVQQGVLIEEAWALYRANNG